MDPMDDPAISLRPTDELGLEGDVAAGNPQSDRNGMLAAAVELTMWMKGECDVESER
jgi:hypothetical protein